MHSFFEYLESGQSITTYIPSPVNGNSLTAPLILLFLGLGCKYGSSGLGDGVIKSISLPLTNSHCALKSRVERTLTESRKENLQCDSSRASQRASGIPDSRCSRETPLPAWRGPPAPRPPAPQHPNSKTPLQRTHPPNPAFSNGGATIFFSSLPEMQQISQLSQLWKMFSSFKI